MSSIDERVVQMRFDNKQFESGVKETMSSLDRLKEKLSFKGAEKSFREVERAAERIDFSGVLGSLDRIEGKLQERFSLWGNMTRKWAENFADTVEMYGKKSLKVLTGVDQFKPGLDKFSNITRATAAIKSALPDTEMSVINEYLADLNKYTDETSYDLVDMVDNIGKFVANGVSLDVAVEAMKGIGNEAAKAGQGIGEAKRAMYNFSQALASGKVRLMDWRSIENANMATADFKNTILETAVELGVLETSVDKSGATLYKTTKLAGKAGKKFLGQDFADSLSYEWFTADVLTTTLGKYADRTTEFGNEAFLAAQQARTFGDAMNAIRDAASTGWMNSFQLVVGDMEEATEVWTNLCNAIIEVTDASSSWRNEVLQGWRDLGGRDSMLSAAQNLWFTFSNLYNMGADVFRQILGPTGESLANATKGLENFSVKLKDWAYGMVKYGSGTLPRISALRHIVQGFASGIKLGGEVVGQTLKFLGGQIKKLLPFTDDILVWLSKAGISFRDFVSKTIKENKIGKFFDNLSNTLDPIVSRIPKLGSAFLTFGKNMWTAVKNSGTWSKITDWFSGLKDNVKAQFPGIITGVANFFDKVVAKLSDPKTVTKIKDFVKNLRTQIGNKLASLGEKLKPIGEKISNGFSTVWNTIVDFFSSGKAADVWSDVKTWFGNAWNWIVEKWGDISKALEPVGAKLSEGFTVVKDAVVGFFTSGTFKTVWDDISRVGTNVWNAIVGWFEGGGVQNVWKNVKTFGLNLWESISDWFGSETVQNVWNSIKDFAVGLWDAVKSFFSTDTSGIEGVWEKLSARFSKFGELFLSVFESVKKKVPEILAKIGPFIVEKFKQLGAWISGAAGSIGGWFSDIFAKLFPPKEEVKKTEELNVFQRIWEKIKGFFQSIFNTGTAIFIGAAVVVGLLVYSAIKILGSIDRIKNAGKPSKLEQFGTMMLRVGGAILMIAAAVGVLSLIPQDALIRGAAVIGGILLAVGLLALAVRAFGLDNVIKSISMIGISLLAMSVGILLLIPAMLTLSTVPWDAFIDAVGKVAVLMLALGIAARIAGSGGSGWQTVVALAAGALIMALSLKIVCDTLIGIPVAEAIGCVLALGGLIAVLGFSAKLAGNTKGAILAFAGMALALDRIRAVFDTLRQFRSTEEAIVAAGAIALLVATLTGAFVVLGNMDLGSIIKGALAIVLLCGALAAGVALIGIGAKSALENIASGIETMGEALENFSDNMKNADDGAATTAKNMISDIGAAMWDVFQMSVWGSGGAMSRVATAIFTLGSTLSTFSTNVKNASSTSAAKAKQICDKLAEVFTTIATITFTNFSTFKTNTFSLGSQLKTFSFNMSEVDTTNTSKAKTVVDQIKEVADVINSIPDVKDLAVTITNIGSAITLYNEVVGKIQNDGTDGGQGTEMPTKGIADTFRALAADMPDTSAIEQVSRFANDGGGLTNFALGITSLTNALQYFSSNMGSVDQGLIQMGIGNLQSFVAIGNALPEKTTIETMFKKVTVEQQSLTEFGANISELGDGLAAFGNSLKDIKSSDLKKEIDAADALRELSEKLDLSSQKSFWEMITGQPDAMQSFADNIGILGTGLKDFYTEAYADGADYSKLTSKDGPIKAFESLVDIMNAYHQLESSNFEGSGVTIETFGMRAGDLIEITSYLPQLGANMNEFVKSFGDGDTEKLGILANSLAEIASAFVSITGMTSETFSLDFLNGLGDALIANIGEVDPGIDTVIDHFNRKASSFVAVGAFYIDGLIIGLTSNQQRLFDTAQSIADRVSGIFDSSWEIGSPAKKGIEQTGWYCAGLGQGFEKSRDIVIASAHDTATSVSETIDSDLVVPAKKIPTLKINQDWLTAVEGISLAGLVGQDRIDALSDAFTGLFGTDSSFFGDLKDGIDSIVNGNKEDDKKPGKSGTGGSGGSGGTGGGSNGAGQSAGAAASARTATLNDVIDRIADVEAAVLDVSYAIGSMNDSFSEIGVTLDGKTLIGHIDKELGKRARR